MFALSVLEKYSFHPSNGPSWMINILLGLQHLFLLFDLILYVPSTIFQLCRDGSSWVEPVLS